MSTPETRNRKNVSLEERVRLVKEIMAAHPEWSRWDAIKYLREDLGYRASWAPISQALDAEAEALVPRQWGRTEPVEVRLEVRESALMLLAYTDRWGRVSCVLEGLYQFDEPMPLSTLRSSGVLPRKAVEGWQLEVIEYCHGAGIVIEVR